MTQRAAVIDLGSNSFRLVVFSWDEHWWKRTDEIYEPVRVGEGMQESGALQPEPMRRALETLDLFAHFCRHACIEDVRAVATSAIRDATNREAFLAGARERSGLDVTVASGEDEARFGYLAAVNTTRLDDGLALDIGGGSMQLTRVSGRRATAARSWALGAVRMTERFLPGEEAEPDQIAALREHVAAELAQVGWIAGERLAGVGGTVRNLAAAAMAAAGLPAPSVQGFELTRTALDDLIARLAARSVAQRRKVAGIKPERGDLILAGALVVRGVLEAGGFDAVEVTEAGLREGVFFAGRDPQVVPDVREAGVRNLAAQYGTDFVHAEHVARLAVGMWDELAAQGLHPGDPDERQLIETAALLHDVGTAIDYDDHHKHSRYLILNGGLPGHSPRETALIAQMARYHRKGNPGGGDLAPLLRDGDDAWLRRGAALLRLAEQLDRSRDQAVRRVAVAATAAKVLLTVEADEDAHIARWSAQRHGGVFERAFGRELEIA